MPDIMYCCRQNAIYLRVVFFLVVTSFSGVLVWNIKNSSSLQMIINRCSECIER